MPTDSPALPSTIGATIHVPGYGEVRIEPNDKVSFIGHFGRNTMHRAVFSAYARAHARSVARGDAPVVGIPAR